MNIKEKIEEKIRRVDLESKTKLIKEKRVEKNPEIENVVIESTYTDVVISPLKATNDIQLILYGRARKNDKIEIETSIVADGVLFIKVKNQNEEVNGVKLYVELPQNRYFNNVSVKTDYADINVKEGILAEQISLTSNSGGIKTKADTTKTKIKSKSGNIKFYANPMNDIAVAISSSFGDIVTEFKNISALQLDEKTEEGMVSNLFKANPSGYKAEAEIKSIIGDIKIK